jgi:spore coat-associated protein N
LKKSKFLISITFVFIALSALLVGGFTAASFTSVNSVDKNMFESGRLEVQLDRENGSHYFNISNVAPGDSGSTEVVIFNKGSIDFEYQMLIEVTGKLGVGNSPISFILYDRQGNRVALQDSRRLAAGEKEILFLVWQMPSSAGNEYQGAAAQMDLSVLAEQVSG